MVFTDSNIMHKVRMGLTEAVHGLVAKNFANLCITEIFSRTKLNGQGHHISMYNHALKGDKKISTMRRCDKLSVKI